MAPKKEVPNSHIGSTTSEEVPIVSPRDKARRYLKLLSLSAEIITDKQFDELAVLSQSTEVLAYLRRNPRLQKERQGKDAT